MNIEYTSKRFSTGSEIVIADCNAIIEQYQAEGYKLTLRQLYYRLVAAAKIENNERSYDRIGSIVNDARLAGRIDWDAIEDRTRNVRSSSHWAKPSEVIRSAAACYALDKWEGQEVVPEIWVEKEALASIVERVATRLDVAYLSCRGYMSQSEMHEAALRFVDRINDGQEVVIIHLGDHDPSGIDMTRDIDDRLERFINYHTTVDFQVKRIALNMDQVEEYNPPPNPAKVTDSRYASYVEKFGESSWELDALEPSVLEDLMEDAVLQFRDDEKYEAIADREREERQALRRVCDKWSAVSDFVSQQ